MTKYSRILPPENVAILPSVGNVKTFNIHGNFEKILMFVHLSYTKFIKTLRKTTEKGEKGFINTKNFEKFT